VPESSLVRLSHLELDPASGGPRIDQFGRCSDPAYFAAGNLLRPIETAGWSFREGRRIAGLLAADLRAELPVAAPGIAIDCSGPLKLCVPQRLLADPTPGLAHLQLRVSEAASGRLRILADGRPVWERALSCLPERRLLVPLAALRLPPDTRRLEVAFLTSGH
ncbi:TPA: pyridine nucleotide-disulfide oxidoreductase, partial [Pseudomonas aeruginosa]|nr:pyridine nucleotide-disulfide oxidoreductase [Pseudomonas aeruginosa]